MSGSAGDMGSLLKQAQEMQRALDRVHAELADTVVDGTAGGGVVRVTVTGAKEVRAVEITPQILKTADHDTLEDLVLSAMRDALRKADELSNESIGKVTGGLDLPGLFH